MGLSFPLSTPSPPPSTSGIAALEMDFTLSNVAYRVAISVGVTLTPPVPGEVTAMTPVATSVVVRLVPISPVGLNISTVLVPSSASLEIDGAELSTSTTTANTVDLPLSLTLDTPRTGFAGSANSDIEYLGLMAWAGSLYFAGFLSNGTRVTRDFPIAISAITIVLKGTISATVLAWTYAAIVWASDLAIIGVGIHYIRKPVSKPFRRRK